MGSACPTANGRFSRAAKNLNGSIVWKPAWAMSTWLWTSSRPAIGGSPVAPSNPLGSTDLRRHLLVLPEAMALMQRAKLLRLAHSSRCSLAAFPDVAIPLDWLAD